MLRLGIIFLALGSIFLFWWNVAPVEAQTLTQEHYQWFPNTDSPEPGAVTNDPTVGNDVADDIAINTASATMYVVGFASGSAHWRIEARDLPDGSLIWATTSDPTSGNDEAFDVAVNAASGTMYVVGAQNGSANWRMEARNLSNGSLIWATSSDPTGFDDAALAIALNTASATMYVVGHQNTSANWRIEARNLSDGSLIYATTANPTIFADVAHDIAINTASATMYVVGHENGAGKWRIEARNLSDGSLVYATTSNPSGTTDEANSIALNVASGTMYVAGHEGTESSWRIEKRNLSDGSLVYAIVNNVTGGATDEAKGIAINTASGTMYVVGQENTTSLWRIEARNLSDGSLIYAVSENVTVGALDEANNIALNTASATMYVVGYQNGEKSWRIEKRNLSDGSNVWGSLAALDTAATDVASGTVARLRMNVGVTGTVLGTSTQTFKLQFATSTEGPWSDMGGTASSTIWRGYDNPTPADGSTITSFILDSSTAQESYEESNNSASNPTAITVGGFGEWDWAIQNNGAVTSTAYNYYFRMVYSSGTALDVYSRYPTIGLAAAAAAGGGAFFNTAPIVQNFTVSQSTSTQLVTFSYEVKDREQKQVWVNILLNVPGELIYDLSFPEFKTTGISVTVATSVSSIFTIKTATWDPTATTQFKDRYIPSATFRLVVHDGSGGLTTVDSQPIAINPRVPQQETPPPGLIKQTPEPLPSPTPPPSFTTQLSNILSELARLLTQLFELLQRLMK